MGPKICRNRYCFLLFSFLETKLLFKGVMHHTKPPGRPRKKTADQDFQITLSSIEDPWKSIAEIKSYLDLVISNSIISQGLTEGKLYSCVARQKTKLSPMHRARRKRFAECFLDFNGWGRTVLLMSQHSNPVRNNMFKWSKIQAERACQSLV